MYSSFFKNGKKTAGIVMASTGFLLILANASGYLLGSDSQHTSLLIIGLVLTVTGINLARER